MKPVATTPEVIELVKGNSPVAIGVSGGKDSCAVAFATMDYLDRSGHTGPRILIHSDLGRTEWADSLPTCERLAKQLGLELAVVRRSAGDMMARWETRWKNSVERYTNLECVKLILPWSTPSMRFCTSELKTAIITRELTKRWHGQSILSVIGIRREESASRKKAPIAKPQQKLTLRGCFGLDWNAILEWNVMDVFDCLAEHSFPLHEAYSVFGASRVSCVFCIMSAISDMIAGLKDARNWPLYRLMVNLELESTFAFQENKWLADIAPHLIGDGPYRIAMAKDRAGRRETAEARIPKHLLYVKGWPTAIPTDTEAKLLSEVREEVCFAVGIRDAYPRPDMIQARYAELMEVQAVPA